MLQSVIGILTIVRRSAAFCSLSVADVTLLSSEYTHGSYEVPYGIYKWVSDKLYKCKRWFNETLTDLSVKQVSNFHFPN